MTIKTRFYSSVMRWKVTGSRSSLSRQTEKAEADNKCHFLNIGFVRNGFQLVSTCQLSRFNFKKNVSYYISLLNQDSLFKKSEETHKPKKTKGAHEWCSPGERRPFSPVLSWSSNFISNVLSPNKTISSLPNYLHHASRQHSLPVDSWQETQKIGGV